MPRLFARSSLALPLFLVPFAGAALARTGEPADAATSAAPPVVEAPAPVPEPVAVAVELDRSLRPLRAEPGPARAYAPERAPWRVTFGDQAVPYRVLAVQALPEQTVELTAPGAVTLRYAAGSAVADGEGRWRWTAPAEPGIVPLAVTGPEGEVRLNVLVLHPREHQRGESLHGFRIGHYRAKPLRGSPRYLPPAGFVALAAEDADVLVSPHLTLGQFRCKQPGEPAFLHLTPALLLKLEAMLEEANASGYDAPTFHVMSGFRTPAYNAGIGNETVYSRHLWGDAADVWVDADGDGEMDDWSGDGRVDLADARILLAIADRVEGRNGVLEGGLGLYRRNSAHGPFVHVDARGWTARW